MNPRGIKHVRPTIAWIAPAAAWRVAPLARHVDEAPATAIVPRASAPLDSYALHLAARRARARMLGAFIVRAGRTLLAAVDRLVAGVAARAPKRRARCDVI